MHHLVSLAMRRGWFARSTLSARTPASMRAAAAPAPLDVGRAHRGQQSPAFRCHLESRTQTSLRIPAGLRAGRPPRRCRADALFRVGAGRVAAAKDAPRGGARKQQAQAFTYAAAISARLPGYGRRRSFGLGGLSLEVRCDEHQTACPWLADASCSRLLSGELRGQRVF